MISTKNNSLDEIDRSETNFEIFNKTHQEKVRNTCFRFVHNREDADDLAQEVFIQIHESLAHFRQEAEISTWIYRIAVNKSLNFVRREKRKRRFAQFKSLFGAGEEEEEIVPGVGGNPQRDLEDRERSEILRRALESLPENQRTAITLSEYDDFSNKEIAEIMDLSLPAVEALIHRAKRNLHKQLYEYFEKRP
jgi:RNA polymerase sigma-70 factor, ECF subfamily